MAERWELLLRREVAPAFAVYLRLWVHLVFSLGVAASDVRQKRVGSREAKKERFLESVSIVGRLYLPVSSLLLSPTATSSKEPLSG